MTRGPFCPLLKRLVPVNRVPWGVDLVTQRNGWTKYTRAFRVRKRKWGTNSLQGVSTLTLPGECCINKYPKIFTHIFFSDSLWAALNSIIKILGFVKGLEFILYSSTGFLDASLLPLFTNKSFSFSHHFLSPPKYTEKLTKWIIVSYLTNNYFLLFLSV